MRWFSIQHFLVVATFRLYSVSISLSFADVFKHDPDYLANEEKYQAVRKEIVADDSDGSAASDAEDSDGDGSDASDSEDEDQEKSKSNHVLLSSTSLRNKKVQPAKQHRF